MTKVSEAQRQQRQEAPLKHGAFAFQSRGESALKPEGRTRLMELRDQVQDRDGVLGIMQEKAADSVLLFELVQSFVAGQVKMGVPLGDITALKSLPAFFNSMQRALTSLISIMPKETDAIDADKVLKAVRDGKKSE
jgi:hypothetical protein